MARKSHVNKDVEAGEAFKKTLHKKIIDITFAAQTEFTSVNLYFEDECRFGLFTRNGKTLTAKGVKPICPFHQVNDNRWTTKY